MKRNITRRLTPLGSHMGVVLLLLSPTVATAQPPTAALTADRDAIQLSDSLRVTLTVEGAAPLRVEVPEKLLADSSEQLWRIRPAGPAKVEAVQPGRDRWTQTFRLDPYLVGEKLTLAFAPLKVTAGNALNPASLVPEAKAIRVRTSIAEAKAENARPVTGIEELPLLPVDPPDRVGWMIAGGAALIVGLVAVAALRRRWRAGAAPVPPGMWAAAAFDRLERDGVTGREFADRVAEVFREFVHRRYGLAAPRLTTAELIAECERAGWPTERTSGLRDLLERCDRAKFANDVPDATEAAELLRTARDWVRDEFVRTEPRPHGSG